MTPPDPLRDEEGFAPGPSSLDEGRRDKRIIVSFPSHPLVFMFYLVLLFPLFLAAPYIFGYLSYLLGLPKVTAFLIGPLIFLMSLVLSPINIVIKRIRTGRQLLVFEQRYVNFFGIPFPVITPRIVMQEVVLAINVGGAIIPITMSILLLLRIAMVSTIYFVESLIVIAVTAAVSYASSRAIPGVGIAVPAFLPPLTSVIVTSLLVHETFMAMPIAYIGGVLGSLIGADLLRLSKELEKFIEQYGATMLSIGGAGTFDGIYLSGLIASLLAPIFTY